MFTNRYFVTFMMLIQLLGSNLQVCYAGKPEEELEDPTQFGNPPLFEIGAGKFRIIYDQPFYVNGVKHVVSLAVDYTVGSPGPVLVAKTNHQLANGLGHYVDTTAKIWPDGQIYFGAQLCSDIKIDKNVLALCPRSSHFDPVHLASPFNSASKTLCEKVEKVGEVGKAVLEKVNDIFSKKEAHPPNVIKMESKYPPGFSLKCEYKPTPGAIVLKPIK